MLSLSKKTDYALIALAYLAERPMRVVPAREISEHFNLPPALLVNILKTLHHSRMVHSERGTHGGYQISLDPEKVTLHDLVSIVDRPVKMIECADLPEGCKDVACRIVGSCPVEVPLKILHQRLIKFLKETRLADLIVPGRRANHLPSNGASCAAVGATA
jgi:Rrf2 family protein